MITNIIKSLVAFLISMGIVIHLGMYVEELTGGSVTVEFVMIISTMFSFGVWMINYLTVENAYPPQLKISPLDKHLKYASDSSVCKVCTDLLENHDTYQRQDCANELLNTMPN